MTLRNLLATNFLLIGWGSLIILGCTAFTVDSGHWPDALPDGWWDEVGFIAAAGIGVGIFLRQDRWQGETRITASLDTGSRFEGLDKDVPDMGADLWPNGLSGIIWLP